MKIEFLHLKIINGQFYQGATSTGKLCHVNFNYLETADILRICNAKIYVNVERQSSYVMNKDRNKVLPIYLIPSDPGLISGFMITHYTVNSLA